jgi:hypothetical protein
MTLVNSIFTWIMKKRMHQIELFIKYPYDVQDEWFQTLISTAKNTEWGKKYGYPSVKQLSDFQRQVPINDYDDLKPWIDRLVNNEQGLLWSTDIRWFAKSSGTTNDKSKFIPVSKEAIKNCHFRGGKDLLSLYYENYPEASLYSGKNLVVGGSAQINSLSHKSYTGDLSAIILKNLPWWAEIRRTPAKDIALLTNWEEKVDKMARSTMVQDVRIIAGVPSWTLVLLKHILEISGKASISEIWPNLELFMHGGVSFVPYKQQFEKIITNPNMHYVETYNASEGFFGIQDRLFADDLLLMLDYGIFYEFIPMDEYKGTESTNLLPLEAVKTGVNYAIVISTNGGLWRYLLGDTVMFTSTNPYRIQVSGRTKHFINTFGEELIIDNAEKALSIVCQKLRCSVKEYTAAPIYMSDGDGGTGAHQWLIEFEQEPANLSEFSQMLDDILKQLNSDYEAKRAGNLNLRMLEIQQMPNGTFYEWLKLKGKLGGQNKVPRLANDRKMADELSKFVVHE